MYSYTFIFKTGDAMADGVAVIVDQRRKGLTKKTGRSTMCLAFVEVSSHVILGALCIYLHHRLHLQWTVKGVGVLLVNHLKFYG